jgi:hypothetical protein
MSEDKSNKAGLHREISSIFKGVPIPRDDDGQGPSGNAQSAHTDHGEPKPPATEPQKPEATEAYQVTQSSPNTAKPEQPKADIDDAEKNNSGAKGLPSWETEDAEGPGGKIVPQGAGHGEPTPQEPKTPKASPSTQSLPNVVTGEQPKADIDDAKKNTAGGNGIPHWKTDDAEQPAGTAAPKGTGYGKLTPQKPEAQRNSPAAQSSPKSTSAQQPKARIDEARKDTPKKRGAVVKISNGGFLERIKNKFSEPGAGGGEARQKTMALVIPVLFVVLLFFVYKGGLFGTRVREAQANRLEKLSGADTTDFGDGIDWEIPALFPATLRDPLRSDALENVQAETEAKTGTPVRVVVNGILYSEDKASAVVGNKIVRQGDRIQGATVIRIDKDSVEFEMNGRRWTEKVRRKSSLGESQHKEIRPDGSGKELL